MDEGDSAPEQNSDKVLQRKKRVAKTQLTKAKTNLTALLCQEAPETADVQKYVDQITISQEEVLDTLLALCEIDETKYESELNEVQADQTVCDMLKHASNYVAKSKADDSAKDKNKKDLEESYDGSDSGAAEANKTDSQSHASGGIHAIGQDMWKQLNRVSIPIFDGEKRKYESWKAAFTACIDQAPATQEYKLLQLRQYLSGEAAKVVENLGHSAAAYEAAKERLNRKFGGARRRVAIQLEELESFRPLRPGNARELEKFADLLDITIINLEDHGLDKELTSRSLYARLLTKMPESMVTNFNRWLFEKSKSESIHALREWIMMESEFRTCAFESVKGVKSTYQDGRDQRRERTLFGTDSSQKNYEYKACPVCKNHHGAWKCDKFKKMDTRQRWDLAKKKKVPTATLR